MEFLSNLDPNTVVLLALACGGICVVSIVLIIAAQAFSSVMGVFIAISQFFTQILSGGPIAWCGCLVVIFLCIGLVGGGLGLASLHSTCSADPSAMNFCALLGYGG